MTLGETISLCRRRGGLSQEALAERVGVSRQAVSKWELDEATPEVDRLVILAREFHITVDQLLSGEPLPEPETASAAAPPQSLPDFSGHLGALGRLIRRFGWLAGVYIAMSGLGIVLVASIACYMFGEAARSANEMMGWGGQDGVIWEMEPAGGGSLPPGSYAGDLFPGAQGGGMIRFLSIPLTVARIGQVAGGLVVLVGVGLALFLWKKGRRGD